MKKLPGVHTWYMYTCHTKCTRAFAFVLRWVCSSSYLRELSNSQQPSSGRDFIAVRVADLSRSEWELATVVVQ